METFDESELEFRIYQRVAASRSVVWRALSSPQGLQGWQADRVKGGVSLGAKISLCWPALGAELEVKVHRLENERCIALSHAGREVVLEVADGAVRLTHTAIADEDERAGALAAWKASLATLAHYCDHYPGAARTVHWLVGEAHTSAEVAYTFFTDRIALGSWLGRSQGDLTRAAPAVLISVTGFHCRDLF